ncbi:hypothetical protein NL676_009562 [Syzygium grande]|nr:hypothetical protein NL676_009562 [Syzygium grande]
MNTAGVGGKGECSMSSTVTASIRESVRDMAIGKIKSNEKADRAIFKQAIDQRTWVVLFKTLDRQIFNDTNGCISTGKDVLNFFAVQLEGDELDQNNPKSFPEASKPNSMPRWSSSPPDLRAQARCRGGVRGHPAWSRSRRRRARRMSRQGWRTEEEEDREAEELSPEKQSTKPWSLHSAPPFKNMADQTAALQRDDGTITMSAATGKLWLNQRPKTVTDGTQHLRLSIIDQSPPLSCRSAASVALSPAELVASAAKAPPLECRCRRSSPFASLIQKSRARKNGLDLKDGGRSRRTEEPLRSQFATSECSRRASHACPVVYSSAPVQSEPEALPLMSALPPWRQMSIMQQNLMGKNWQLKSTRLQRWCSIIYTEDTRFGEECGRDVIRITSGKDGGDMYCKTIT